jgi:hypothetical protein
VRRSLIGGDFGCRRSWGGHWRKRCRKADGSAVLLPNAVGSVVTFAGLQAFGRVPCLLNPSAGASNVLATCRTAAIRSVVSSRDFIQRAKLTNLVEQMRAEVRFVWLEDIRAHIGMLKRYGRRSTHGCRIGCRAPMPIPQSPGGGAVHQRVRGQPERALCSVIVTFWPTARSCRR